MELEERGLRVISVMKQIPELSHLPVDSLNKIPLGWLTKRSILTHGICRFDKNLRSRKRRGPLAVEHIKINPEFAQNEKWSRYADHTLYHEFLHALGFWNHNEEFRKMEGLWPDIEASGMGKEFSDFLQDKYCKWELACPSCEWKVLYSRRPDPRSTYICKKCKSIMDCFEREPRCDN
jgi:predicted SprT family Zn-dependent metalloprotease